MVKEKIEIDIDEAKVILELIRDVESEWGPIERFQDIKVKLDNFFLQFREGE